MTPVELALAAITATGAILNCILLFRSNSQSNAIQKQRADISGATLAVNTVMAANSELRTELVAIKEDAAAQRNGRERLEKALDAASRSNTSLVTEVGTLQKSVIALQDQRDSLASQLAELRGKLAEQRENHAAEVSRYTKFMDDRISALEAELTNVRKDLQTANAENKILQRELDQFKAGK